MTITIGRITLVTIFLLGLAIQIVSIILSYSEGAIAHNDLSNLIIKLLTVYSVHLAIIFGGIFAQQTRGAANVKVSPIVFWVAVTAASIWNLLLAWRTVKFGIAAYNPDIEDSVSKLVSYVDSISSASSFLVAGALAFFFSKK